ncbi:FAD/NAD(P)-binding domain-containing protein [Rhizodiscina lignyota]|uniref:FAD/NAD(P)-binding domain-containing protein n=1 Tax=Rhizodiscina lignyota TaxID=1504668 RepID=A0A9P4IMB3_9PEZI|nr:FAD/NAD(P)-binding domain-containing protein [Rhizodiscina lignyota]
MGYHIIVVGAGIAGLAAANALARKGNKVTVLESKPALNEFGASIGINPNGVRCLVKWGLEKKFESVVTKNGFTDIRDAANNERLGRLAINHKKYGTIKYGSEAWNIHRADYQQTLAMGAIEMGATILFDAKCIRVDLERLAVILEDGREIAADLIVGADGMRSPVRHSIPVLASVEPKPLFEQTWRCTVPKDRMVGVPTLDWLLKNHDSMCWTTEGKYILTWPMPPNRFYDVVCVVVRESTVPPGVWGTKADPVKMKKNFQDLCPEVRDLLDRVDACVEWTQAELPPIDTFRSEDGRVVLMGDACHAMIPHSASGGNSAIEDAAVLAECISWASDNGQPLSRATEAYEVLRKPRVQRMQTASHEGYGFLGAGGDLRPIRDAGLAQQTKALEAELNLSEEERMQEKPANKDMKARFPSAPYLQWLYATDVTEEAKSYLAGLDK